MLNAHEILRIVEDYVGVEEGNLKDFTVRSLNDFFPHYCGLEIDLSTMQGTKRSQLIAVLQSADCRSQAKILRGLLHKFPKEDRATLKQQATGMWIEGVISRLEGSAVHPPTLKEASDVVSRAIEDADALVRHNDPISAVDRVHTALHGYLKQVCKSADLTANEDASLPQLYKKIRTEHPSFTQDYPHKSEIDRVINALAQAVDSLGTIRNRGSVAHPNEQLVGVDEAILVRNAGNTILTYVAAKVDRSDDQ